MTKQDIISNVAKATNLPLDDSRNAIEAFIETVKQSLAEGHAVIIRGFGSFSPLYRPAKKGRNIKKNLSIDIPETTVPKFKASDEFKAALGGAPIKRKVKKSTKLTHTEAKPLANVGDNYKTNRGNLWQVYDVQPVLVKGKVTDYEYKIWRKAARRVSRRKVTNSTIFGNVVKKEAKQ
jgi:DNA-binding protein HU-beta